MKNKGFEPLGDIFKARQIIAKAGQTKKPPAYEWQDLALRVINELGVPNFKRSAVFKVCKENSRVYVERCLNETEELCRTGQKWKYFFKLANQKN